MSPPSFNRVDAMPRCKTFLCGEGRVNGSGCHQNDVDAAAVSPLGIVIIGGRKAEDLKCPDVAGTLYNALFGAGLVVGDALLA